MLPAAAGISALSDGRVMVTGGNTDYKTSIFNPVANNWVAGPQMNIPRGYQARLCASCRPQSPITLVRTTSPLLGRATARWTCIQRSPDSSRKTALILPSLHMTGLAAVPVWQLRICATNLTVVQLVLFCTGRPVVTMTTTPLILTAPTYYSKLSWMQATAAMSDGRVFVIGGSWAGGTGGKNGEVSGQGLGFCQPFSQLTCSLANLPHECSQSPSRSLNLTGHHALAIQTASTQTYIWLVAFSTKTETPTDGSRESNG